MAYSQYIKESLYSKDILNNRITHRNPVTIVAIMKKEQLFLQEWLNHHIALGVKKFVLYNNDESNYRITVPDDVKVIIIDYSMYYYPCTQMQAYDDACSNLMGETVLMIDIDEFVSINPDFQKKLDKRRPLLEAAFEYFEVDALALSWLDIGADGRIERPNGGVKESYLKPCPKVRETCQFKSMYRLNQGVRWIRAHRAKCDIPLYDTDKNIVEYLTTKDLYDKIYIKHYITKSWEDYVAKLKRGNFTRGLRNLDTFFQYNPDMVHLKSKLTNGLDLSEFPTIKSIR